MNGERILLAGSSGFIGTSVIRVLLRKRISIVTLRRSPRPEPVAGAHTCELWDPYSVAPFAHPERLEGIRAAVHLGGAAIAGKRWSSAYKREILESRVRPTHALAKLLAGLNPRPEVLVCASAIGVYGDRGDEILTEASLPGAGFLPEVCVAWERATKPASDAGIRVVHLRFGVVLSSAGGALKQMLPVFRAGLGGRLGNGRQWMSWIGLPDAVRAVEFALESSSLSGPVNVVSPEPVTNADFTRSLGNALHRPAWLPVPAVALRLVFGEMAPATLLASSRVMPAGLSSAGFDFESPRLALALGAALLRS